MYFLGTGDSEGRKKSTKTQPMQGQCRNMISTLGKGAQKISIGPNPLQTTPHPPGIVFFFCKRNVPPFLDTLASLVMVMSVTNRNFFKTADYEIFGL